MMKKRQILERAGAVLFALALWQAAAMLLNQRILLVTPVSVVRRLGTLLFESGFWSTVGFSFLRIEAGFFLGLFIGTVMAVCSARFHLIETMLWPFMTVAKTVPVASFIIICLIWLDASSLSVFISFLMVFPIVYFNVLQGMKSTDRSMLQMADIFRVSYKRRLFYIYMPQVRPFFTSACAAALGISWKAGIAAEVIGIPNGSIGERLYEAKIYLNTADLLAWTVVIVLISVAFEKLFMKLIQRCFAGLERL